MKRLSFELPLMVLVGFGLVGASLLPFSFLEREKREQERYRSLQWGKERRASGCGKGGLTAMAESAKVRVGVRVRPLLPREAAQDVPPIISHPSEKQVLVDGNAAHRFTYDHVFPVHASQRDLYASTAAQMLQPFLDVSLKSPEYICVECKLCQFLLRFLYPSPLPFKLHCCCCCLLYTSPSPRDGLLSRMPSSA